MKAELKALISSDFDERFHEKEGDNFSFWIQAFVGPEGEEGQEQFQVQVCTPRWLLGHDREDVIMGTGRIIVFEYHWSRMERAIRQWVNRWRGNSWHELALKVARLGDWEFDNYTPYTPALSGPASRSLPQISPPLRAEVKSITRSDFDGCSDWEEGDNNFSLWIHICVGPEGEDVQEQFRVQVCTPKWLLANHGREEVVFGTGRIIVFEYHWPRLEQFVRGWVSRRSAPNWPELALQVARLGPPVHEAS